MSKFVCKLVTNLVIIELMNLETSKIGSERLFIIPLIKKKVIIY